MTEGMIASSGAPVRIEPRNNDSMTVATGNPVKRVVMIEIKWCGFSAV
jgi:hypothetical protein